MDGLDRLIESRFEFHDALHIAFDNIGRAGCREVFLCDDDFADWPLGSAETVALLTAWARPHRRLQVLARHFDGLARQQPRWVAWRRQWSHVVACRSPGDGTEDGSRIELPTLLVAPGLLAVRLTDRNRFRGRLTTQADEIQSLRQHFDAISQQTVDSFPATTLGL